MEQCHGDICSGQLEEKWVRRHRQMGEVERKEWPSELVGMLLRE